MSVREAVDGLRRDHVEHRPRTAREWGVYTAELWCALGLWWRAWLHIIIWCAIRRERHGVAAVPHDVEWGLTGDIAVQDAGLSVEETAAVQALTSFLTATATLHVWTAAAGLAVSPVVALLVVGPALAVPVGDPVWGTIHEYRQATDADSSENL